MTRGISMDRKMTRVFKNLPISLRILGGFLSVCCALAGTSAFVYYRQSRNVVLDSIQDQAATQGNYVRHRFEMEYADPLRRELRLLVRSPQLEDYLASSREELLVHRAEVEKLFLSLARQRDIYRSITFLDAHGREQVGICDNNRRRVFRSLAGGTPDDPRDRGTSALFGLLKSSPSRLRACTAPFPDAQGRWGLLVGMTVSEPETGGFGGVMVLHCDLTAFVQEVAQSRILGTAVAWIYTAQGEVLSSPPQNEPRQDPQPYLAGDTTLGDACIRTVTCSLFAGDAPVLTVVCSIPAQVVAQELAPLIWSVAVIFSVLLGGAGVSSLLLSRWVLKPIKALTRAATQIDVQKLDLDLDARLTDARDEIGVLAHAFQKMVRDLKTSTTSIDNLNREIAERQSLENALRLSEERFRQVAHSTGEFIWEVDADGVYTYAGPVVEKILGYTPAELVGQKHFYDLFVPAEREKLKDMALAGFAQKMPFRGFVNANVHKDGHTVILETSGVPIVDDQGNLSGYRGADSDITERKHTEAALRVSEERFRLQTALLQNVLAHIPYFVFWKDRDSVYLGCNEMFARSAGVASPEAIVGKTDYDLVWKKEAEFYRQCDRQVMDSAVPLLDLEEPQTREDGRRITLLTSKVPLRDSAGRVTGILGIYTDFTARKNLEDALRESEMRFRSVVEQAGDGFELLDTEGRFVDTNGATCRSLGYAKEELLRLSVPDINPLIDHEKYTAILQSLVGQPPKTFESVHRRKNGMTFPVEITTSLIQLGGVPRCLSLVRDITERKKAEEQQAQLLQQLSAINQELKDFAYVVSHDLKAPLRAIKTLADWLTTDYQDKLDEQGRETLRLMGGRVNRMQSLIDGVLQYSRIGRTEQTVVPVDLRQLLPQIVDDLGVPAHIALHVPTELPTVAADQTRITQIFQNLLSNAIKYMDKPQGQITVTCVAEEGFWKFGVADNGPGIAQKDFERIFKLFQTLTRRDDCESTGVGLTVTKKIVEMYGGRIWVESEVGRGSTFFFTFPQRKAGGGPPEGEACQEQNPVLVGETGETI